MEFSAFAKTTFAKNFGNFCFPKHNVNAPPPPVANIFRKNVCFRPWVTLASRFSHMLSVQIKGMEFTGPGLTQWTAYQPRSQDFSLFVIGKSPGNEVDSVREKRPIPLFFVYEFLILLMQESRKLWHCGSYQQIYVYIKRTSKNNLIWGIVSATLQTPEYNSMRHTTYVHFLAVEFRWCPPSVVGFGGRDRKFPGRAWRHTPQVGQI